MGKIFHKFKTHLNSTLEADTKAKEKFIEYLKSYFTTGFEYEYRELTPTVIEHKDGSITYFYWQPESLAFTTNQMFSDDDRVINYKTEKLYDEPIEVEVTEKRTYANFETIIILNPDLTAKEVNRFIRKYKNYISSPALDDLSDPHYKIKVKDIGIKNLAYDIKGVKQGYYVHYEYWQTLDFIDKLEKSLRKETNVLKFISVKTTNPTEEITVRTNLKDTSSIPAAEQESRVIIEAMDIFAKYKNK